MSSGHVPWVVTTLLQPARQLLHKNNLLKTSMWAPQAEEQAYNADIFISTTLVSHAPARDGPINPSVTMAARELETCVISMLQFLLGYCQVLG